MVSCDTTGSAKWCYDALVFYVISLVVLLLLVIIRCALVILCGFLSGFMRFLALLCAMLLCGFLSGGFHSGVI
jgi:hypothetical protein